MNARAANRAGRSLSALEAVAVKRKNMGVLGRELRSTLRAGITFVCEPVHNWVVNFDTVCWALPCGATRPSGAAKLASVLLVCTQRGHALKLKRSRAASASSCATRSNWNFPRPRL